MTRITLTVDKEKLEAFNQQFAEFTKRSQEREAELKRLSRETAAHIENLKRLQQQRWDTQNSQ